MQCFSTTSSLPIPIPAAAVPRRKERVSILPPPRERVSILCPPAFPSPRRDGRDVRVAAVALLICPDGDGVGCHKNACLNENVLLSPLAQLERLFCVLLLEPRPFSSYRSTKGLVSRSRTQKSRPRFAKGERIPHSVCLSLSLLRRHWKHLCCSLPFSLGGTVSVGYCDSAVSEQVI